MSSAETSPIEYSEDAIKTALPKMLLYWPQLLRDDAWMNAWQNHGRRMAYASSLYGIDRYFLGAIAKRTSTDFWTKIQSRYNLGPNNGTIPLNGMMEVISFESERGKIVPLVECQPGNQTSSVLNVYTCVESERWEFTPCPDWIKIDESKKCDINVNFPL